MKQRLHTRARCLVAIVVAMVFAITVEARAENVTIEGEVVDVSGHPVTGVTVSATDPVSGAVVGATSAQQFRLAVPAGIYILATTPPPRPLTPGYVRVDARNGSISGVTIRLTAQTPLVPDDPPRASLVQLSVPDAAGEVTITGTAGAVAPGSFLVLMTMDTGHTVTTQAGDDGSFTASLFAPHGSSVLIKSDPFGFAFRSTTNAFPNDVGPPLSLLAGTIVRVPEPSAGAGVSFARTGTVRLGPGSNFQFTQHAWTLEGTLGSQSLEAGGTLLVEGKVRVVSPAVQQATAMRVNVTVSLDRVSGPDGRGSLGQNTFASTLMTPTGFPIERERNGRAGNGLTSVIEVDLVKTATDRAEASIQLTLTPPAGTPAGFYVPVATFFFDGIPAEPAPNTLKLPIERSARRHPNMTYLPVVRIGSPASPRVPAMLLVDTVSNGSRGVRSVEDRNHFGLSSRIRMDEPIVVPRLDAAGQPIAYRLEPFLPTVALTVAGQPSLPLIPFRFPSGRLTVSVEAPDGSLRVIGPAPLAQPRLKSNGLAGTSLREPLIPFGRVFTLITECYQLTTLDPRFVVPFAQDGRHLITLEGAVDDIWGNSWTLGGTYELHVARPLSLGTAVMPGTPFEARDVLNPSVIIDPAVAADVEVRVRLAPDSDSSRMIERVIRGRANRYGWFTPPEGGFVFPAAGEYRVDVSASFRDATGSLWMGTRTWGSVVAPPQSPIIAHGRRGMVNTNVLGSQWFFRTQTPFPTLPHSSHPNPPFHTGDVFWAQKSDTAFVQFTIQDPQNLVTELLRSRHQSSGVGLRDPGTFDERVPLGELPLFSTRADGVETHIDPSRVDLWGYTYRFVERPMVAVRELVAEDGVQLAYWPFSDPYGGQFGMGPSGDLPNDFKFYFGGAALHGSALATPLYSIYASLFVLVADDDPHGGSRVFPPFQGNGGGPSGGPLFTLKGREIDLFFHPTSIRPGTVLQLGERISFAGYSAPALPSKIEIVTTSPSGRVRTTSGKASAIGYFYDPSQDLTADETGIWKAKVKIVFDGRLPSGGQVTAPFPTGDVLGSREGEFYFYVVSPHAPPLTIVRTGGSVGSPFVRPSDGPLTFTASSPSALTDISMTTTATMPGFVLEETTTSALSYTYDPTQLAKDFPNLDLDSGADTITITFFLSGTDGKGDRRHFARQIVILGEELQIPEQKETAILPRRRSVRK